ncbi:hypothetical protein STEG23_034696, partial [Scotinomys teguina]
MVGELEGPSGLVYSSGKFPTGVPTGNLMEVLSQLRFIFPDDPGLCQVGTKCNQDKTCFEFSGIPSTNGCSLEDPPLFSSGVLCFILQISNTGQEMPTGNRQ